MEQTRDSLPNEAAARIEPLEPLESLAPADTLCDADRRRHARIQSASLALLACGALLTMMWVAKPVLVVIFVSILIAFMLAPVVEIFERLRLPRQASAMIAVLVMCAALYGVFYVSYNQANQFMTQLPKYSGNIRAVLDQVRLRAEHLRQTTQGVLPEDKPEKGTLTVRQTTSWIDEFTSGAIGFTEVAVMAAFIPFLVFFMLSWQDHVRASTVMLFSRDSRNTAYVTLGLISQMVRSFIVGNVVIGIVIGVASSVAFWILGVPYFYVIGMISGIVSLVPYLGIVLAVFPPVVVSIGSLTTEHFVSIVASVAFIHVIALNLLYPKIIGRRMQLNPLAVTLALLFWGWLWGAMGLVLAVPITAALKIVLDHIENFEAWGAWLGE